MLGLSCWEFVGIERVIFVGKSLFMVVRLVCEWSEER